MAQLVVVQAGLSITSPIAQSIRRVYTYPPNRDDVLPDTPCWVNTWTFTSSPGDGQGQRREQAYTVTAQLFVDDADINRGADIATAFHVAWVNAMSNAIRLAGTAQGTKLRGGQPTLGAAQWGGKFYVGLEEYVDITLLDTWTFS